MRMRAYAFTPMVVALVSSSCSSSGQHEHVPMVRESTSIVRAGIGLEGLSRFVPARQPVLEGGECLPGVVEPDGFRRLVAYFPGRREPDTSVSILLDSSGGLVRYNEARGMPRPGRDLAAMQAQVDNTVRTLIQLDYTTGEALASNRGPANDGAVIGTVKEFERTTTLGDLPARADIVRRLCLESQS